jgi:hypothetical protein
MMWQTSNDAEQVSNEHASQMLSARRTAAASAMQQQLWQVMQRQQVQEVASAVHIRRSACGGHAMSSVFFA